MDKIDSFRGDYAFLSNFYNAPVTYNGVIYNNNEAAFQAQKCVNECIKSAFVNLSASEAKHFGHKVTLRNDWEQVKVSIMQEIVKAKFDQNPELADKLLQTGDVKLEEGNNWGDRTWGTVNGVGRNLLGNILMEVRDNLKK